VLERVRACIEEINRLDLVVIAASKTRSSAPAQSDIFEALSHAGIACANAVETLDGPSDVREAVLLLQVAITDFAATLKTYPKLVV